VKLFSKVFFFALTSSQLFSLLTAVFAISPPFHFGKFVQSEPLDTTPMTLAMTVQ
jgi:hypothetical protein